jgi:transcriptional regulator with XRE-family HTH domain
VIAIHTRTLYNDSYYSQEGGMRLGLIAARQALGWTQERLAKEVGKASASSIAHYEKGDSDIPGRVLEQLSIKLRKPIHVLLKIHDDALDTEDAEKVTSVL